MSERIVAITGTSRGIGLGLTKAFLEKGYAVAAVARNPEKAIELKSLQEKEPERLFCVSFDITDEKAITRACGDIEKKWDHVDILINNAGVSGGKNQGSINDVNIEKAREVFDVNVLGPLRVTRRFLPLVEKGQEKKIVHISSLMGSIDDNKSGGFYSYRISKTALNMMNKSLAHELREKGICSVVLHPGWVKTDMGGPEAPTAVEESVRGLLRVILGLKAEDTGSFFDYQGKRIPW